METQAKTVETRIMAVLVLIKKMGFLGMFRIRTNKVKR